MKKCETQFYSKAIKYSESENKESPAFWRGFLQLTTYETQSSLLVAAGALSFTATGGLL